DVIARGQPLPPPTPIVIDDLNYGKDPAKAANLESLEATVVELEDGCVCPQTSDYATFQQWNIGFRSDPSVSKYSCTSSLSISVETAGQVLGWDPPRVGTHIRTVRGILVNIAGQSGSSSGRPYSFFILHPRVAADLVDAGDTCATM